MIKKITGKPSKTTFTEGPKHVVTPDRSSVIAGVAAPKMTALPLKKGGSKEGEKK